MSLNCRLNDLLILQFKNSKIYFKMQFECKTATLNYTYDIINKESRDKEA